MRWDSSLIKVSIKVYLSDKLLSLIGGKVIIVGILRVRVLNKLDFGFSVVAEIIRTSTNSRFSVFPNINVWSPFGGYNIAAHQLKV